MSAAAIVAVLGTLPVRTHWIDSRDEVFPAALPLNVRCEHSEPVQGAVPTLAAGSRVLIMSFSHAEDLDILAACLKRRRESADLPYIGLIGSRSKWATFRHRLQARGFGAGELDAVTCPIGVPGVVGKEPEVIAVAVAAQLMQQRDASAEGLTLAFNRHAKCIHFSVHVAAAQTPAEPSAAGLVRDPRRLFRAPAVVSSQE